jgi:hypothetical protein
MARPPSHERTILRVLFGHNTDVTAGDQTYHVQTEDRGVGHAVIDTTVYSGGMVVHRKTNSYGDLLPLDPQREEVLKSRLDNQHRAVLQALSNGTLRISRLPASKPLAAAASPARETPQTIHLQLLNAKNWLSQGHATLQIAVRSHENGSAVGGARVIARVDGAAAPAEFSTATGADGLAKLAFDMPQLSGPECALVIEARYAQSQGVLRFQLRAKPKSPPRG